MYEAKSFNLLRLVRRIEREAAVDLSKRRLWFVDESVTAANVNWVSGVRHSNITFGETITAGQPLYLDTTTGKYKKADADTDTESLVAGVSKDGGGDGHPGLLLLPGAVYNCGFTTTAGAKYFLSITAGGITQVAPATGDFCVFMFWGTGTANVLLVCSKGSVASA